MIDKIKIGVIYGGTSSEREVSLSSGLNIINNLNREKYELKIYDPKINFQALIDDCLNKKINFCLLALHGPAGEDGKIQGMLDLLNMPYSGSGAAASALCMDKALTKQVLKVHDILMPSDIIIEADDWLVNKIDILENILKRIVFPVVVKPNQSGSSVGVSIVKNDTQISKAIDASFRHDKTIIVEEYIKGVEVTASILGNKILPLIEIVPDNEFFDFEAKYTTGKSQEIVPARLTDELTKDIKQRAFKITKILKCHGLCRVDFIVKNNQIYFLELNTIPGMTENSLCPKSALADGINFTDLLDKIIDLGLKK